MRVKIVEDEWYPVYQITDNDYVHTEGELTAQEIRRIKSAFAAFERAQQLLAESQCRVKGHGKWRTIKWVNGVQVKPYEACGLCDAPRGE